MQKTTRKNLYFVKAVSIRALKTAAQVALSMLTIGQMFSEIDWLKIVSVSGVAAVYSVLTSVVGGIPEATSNGTLYLKKASDISGTEMRFSFNKSAVDILPGDLFTLEVKDFSDLKEDENE